MDLTDSPEARALRMEVRRFLSGELPEGWKGVGSLEKEDRDVFRQSWRDALVRGGLIAPGWPKEYGGGGLGPEGQSVVAEELIRVGAPARPSPNDLFGLDLIGPTLIEWGTPEQKEYFIPRTISGEIRWAQGYSEPEAGSDLFNLRTRAKVEGDEWSINGQKVWQSAGLTANWLFVVVRTNPDAERSKGLSFLLVPIDQPGVEVRGIRNMAGEIDFTEVFFNDARTPLSNTVGGIDNGASVALTLLGYERGAGGVAAALAFQIQADRLVEMARAKDALNDVRVRDRIVRAYERIAVLRALAKLNVSEASSGRAPGAESSIFKLLVSTHHQAVTELAIDVLSIEVLDAPGGSPVDALEPQPLGTDPEDRRLWLSDYLHARAGTIYGGSQEIQRNTIGERVLSLPREPRVTIPPKKS